FSGPPAGPDPWGAESLEWATSSPPPAHNFTAIPVVASTTPLWDVAEGEDPAVVSVVDGEDLARAHHGHHRTLITSVLDADQVEVTTMPGPTSWPFVVALGGLGVSAGFVARSWLVGCAAALVSAVALIAWH